MPILQAFCGATQAPSVPSFDDSMAAVRAWLDSSTGNGLSTLEANGAFAAEAEASAAAAGAASDGNFAGALALELQAYRAEPDDPRHLVNASPLLTVLGRPSDALAFLDHADTMAPADATPMGIDQRAVAQTNRGLALAATGQLEAAHTVLGQALATDGNLTEAAVDLAAVDVCQGSPDDALVLAMRRRVDQVSRLPRGEGAVLPVIKYPRGNVPADTIQLRDYYDKMQAALNERFLADNNQMTQLAGQAASAYTNQVSRDRVESIRRLIVLLDTKDPELVAMLEEMTALLTELGDYGNKMWGVDGIRDKIAAQCGADINCLIERCSAATVQQQGQWRGTLENYDTAVREYWDLAHRKKTALAGIVKNPLWHQILLLEIETEADQWAIGLVSAAAGWNSQTAINAGICLPFEVPPTSEEQKPDAQTDFEACDGTGWPNGFTPTLKIGYLTIKAKCEEIQIEATGKGVAPFDLVAPFAQIAAGTKGVTIFAGSKLGTSGITEPLNLGAKSGMYWTIDGQGNVKDFGWRVQPASVSVSSGPFGLTVWEAGKMDFSFVGISDFMPLIGTE